MTTDICPMEEDDSKEEAQILVLPFSKKSGPFLFQVIPLTSNPSLNPCLTPDFPHPGPMARPHWDTQDFRGQCEGVSAGPRCFRLDTWLQGTFRGCSALAWLH